MANPWPDLFDQLRTAIVAAWPEVEVNGIFETSELQRVSADRTGLPLAIMAKLSVPQDTESQPLGFQCWAPTFAVYRLAQTSEDEDAMRAKLNTLAERLLTIEFAVGKGQVIDVTEIEWSDEQGGNQVLITKNITATVGGLMLRLFTGQDVSH
jgi:hypothetical protein